MDADRSLFSFGECDSRWASKTIRDEGSESRCARTRDVSTHFKGILLSHVYVNNCKRVLGSGRQGEQRTCHC